MKFWFQGKDIECMALTFFMVGVWHLMWWSDSWAQWCTCSSTARATASWASWPRLCICVSPGRSPCNWSYSPLYVAWPACVDWFSKRGVGLCLFFRSLLNSTTGTCTVWVQRCTSTCDLFFEIEFRSWVLLLFWRSMCMISQLENGNVYSRNVIPLSVQPKCIAHLCIHQFQYEIYIWTWTFVSPASRERTHYVIDEMAWSYTGNIISIRFPFWVYDILCSHLIVFSCTTVF